VDRGGRVTELRFALITALRRQGMTWRDIAREFHVKDHESFAQTFRNEVARREVAPIVRVLQKAAR
jgi:hypothetical protein